jgi:2-polyprenyl-6-methoxyphenol hydroxylase-like FAD-dependent oxidoreductase
MGGSYQIRVIIAGGGVVGLVLANALEVQGVICSGIKCIQLTCI